MTKPSADDTIALIRESAARVADRHDLGRIRALRFTPTGFERTTWRAMCELGWPALRIAEEAGGVGLGMTEYCVLAMELAATTPDQQARVEKLKLMTADQNAPLAVYLASDDADGVNGQVFATRHNEIFLMSQSRPLRSVQRSDGWTPELIRDHAMPALRGSLLPLDRSQDVFTWDPC
jgi:hypothetical protein